MSTLWKRLLAGALWNPATLSGALVYLVVFFLLASTLSWLIRRTGTAALRRDTRRILDRTAAYFLIQLGQILVFVLALIAYMHIVPALHALGTALLTGVSVSAVIFGLAAQTTLGNFVSGVSLLIYRPFRVGDRLQITAPTGLEVGTVSSIQLGYTVIETEDKRHVVVPNSVIANQVTVNVTGVKLS